MKHLAYVLLTKKISFESHKKQGRRQEIENSLQTSISYNVLTLKIVES